MLYSLKLYESHVSSNKLIFECVNMAFTTIVCQNDIVPSQIIRAVDIQPISTFDIVSVISCHYSNCKTLKLYVIHIIIVCIAKAI